MKDLLICFGIVLVYLSVLFFLKRRIFFYRFDQSLIERYFHSQDIPYRIDGDRFFLSDGDIYIATGYLYATGTNPTTNNFEHPPLIKYLFGFSILLFNNPYIAQICLGIAFLLTFYFLSKKIFNNPLVSVIATLLLLIDPLFLDISSQPLLDLGQTLFLLLYFISIIYYKDNFVLQGIFLGLFASTKFWIPTFFFTFLFFLYLWYKKELHLGKFIAHLGIAFLAYTLLYTQSFIVTKGHFNIVWHFLRTVKYRIVHNTSTFFGSSYIMYLTSYVQTWWGKHIITSTDPWTPLWPLTFIISLGYVFKNLKNKVVNPQVLIALIPIGYIAYLGAQAPFPRYFMPVLPFSYLILADLIYKKLKMKVNMNKK